MRKSLLVVLCVALVLAASWAVNAQMQPAPPPKVIRIFEESVKVGKAVAHQKLETNWSKAFARANWSGHVLGMVAMTGTPQAWYIQGFDSMAAMEKLDNDTDKMTALKAETDMFATQDGDLLTNTRAIIANYREDISYIGSNAPLATMRYFDVVVTQVRPGHNDEFVESRKLIKDAHEKARMPDNFVNYAVSAGTPAGGGFYIRFRQLKSLAEVDRNGEIHSAKNYQDAVAPSQKRITELESASILNSVSVIYQFDPKMSYMQKDFTSQDPDFWTPKPKVPTKTGN